MEVSRVTSKGQVTIPKAIREQLKLQEGDKLAFIEENGKILLTKSSTIALRQFFDSMNMEAEEKGVTEENLLNDLEEVREEMWNGQRK
ncbi:AbrB/MazE/SpoVT family DNA-binding domain-containing protein [Natribacillus halophilus]|uniref:Looped-hinge helix DNA binding domain-containing protein, AbrB family n=1 Tax=Natribacillus halophilus TaxID=549003 RepID=A0A1G8S756_9BACI|nr:AbrB/MazE/SpoVT family DNA-binding domain-containing protein [Natribacillus halophilus]SDJ25059.1 looped-hinge helix DNA binding domain-containing protein, AbrB family [Natribacillus halophilus]